MPSLRLGYLGLDKVSKKVFVAYVIILLIVGFSPMIGLSGIPEIDIVNPSNSSYYTNEDYVNVSVNITSSVNASSFINWNNSLVGYWNFEHINDTLVFDNSSYKNNATYNNRFESNTTTGSRGTGFYFNGSADQYLNCGNDSSFDITDEITIECWFKEFESSFDITYGNSTGTANDCAYDLQQTSDGGYIITGEIDWNKNDDNTGDALLLKIDSNGNHVKNASYPAGYGEGWMRSVKQTSDGWYVAVGEKTAASGTRQIWIIKTYANLTIERQMSFGNGLNSSGQDVCINTSSGDYVIAAYQTNPNGGTNDKDIWLIQFSDEFAKIYENANLNDRDQRPYSIQETSDMGYIITGQNSPSTGEWDIFLLKAKSNLTTDWLNQSGDYDLRDNSAGFCVQEIISNDGFIITGYTNGTGYNLSTGRYAKADIILIKTDDAGHELWNKTFGEDDSRSVGHSVQQTADGGYIIAGSTNHSKGANGDWDYWLIKTNSGGIEEWNRTFDGDAGDDEAWVVKQTSDGGYIIGGYTNRSGDEDIWIIKTNSTGHITGSNNSQSIDKTLIGKSKSSFQIELFNGTISGYINNNIVSTQKSLSSLSSNFNHVALTYSTSSGAKLYLNKELLDSNNTSWGEISANLNDVVIGKNFSGIIDEVRIWNRVLSHEEINASYSCSSQYNKNFTDLSEGTYPYYVYTIDSDSNENPTSTRYVTIDNTAPTSNLSNITTYWVNSTPLLITATASDNIGLQNVSLLYYYNSTDNTTFTGPYLFGNDIDPWNELSWSFNFTNGSGYYRFYSIATDNASNVENIPNDNDTMCLFTRVPNEPSGPGPSNGSTGVSRTKDLNWTCSDPDGDNLTYDVYLSSDNSTPNSGDLVFHNQTATSYDTGTMSYNTKYYWMIVAWDPYNKSNSSEIWNFTTEIRTYSHTPPPPQETESETNSTNETVDSNETTNQNNTTSTEDSNESNVVTTQFENITIETNKEINISSEKTVIIKLDFRAKVNLSNVTISINDTDRIDKNIVEPTLQDIQKYITDKNVTKILIYKFINIEVLENNSYIEENKTYDTKIVFRVNKTWNKTNDLNKIMLLRYNNTWGILPTSQLEIENDTYFIFEASTPGFSTFAVVGSKIIEKQETLQTDDPIPWYLIVGFTLAILIIVIVVLFKAKFIYIEKTEEREEKKK